MYGAPPLVAPPLAMGGGKIVAPRGARGAKTVPKGLGEQKRVDDELPVQVLPGRRGLKVEPELPVVTVE